MAFIDHPDGIGKIYVPDTNPVKKHPCPDCHDCQWCGDERCELCRKRPFCGGRKPS